MTSKPSKKTLPKAPTKPKKPTKPNTKLKTDIFIVWRNKETKVPTVFTLEEAYKKAKDISIYSKSRNRYYDFYESSYYLSKEYEDMMELSDGVNEETILEIFSCVRNAIGNANNVRLSNYGVSGFNSHIKVDVLKPQNEIDELNKKFEEDLESYKKDFIAYQTYLAEKEINKLNKELEKLKTE